MGSELGSALQDEIDSGDPLNERWRRYFDEEDEQIKTWLADGITRLVVSHAWASQVFLVGHVWATSEAEFCSRAQALVEVEAEARARAEAQAKAEAEARARAEARAKAEADARARAEAAFLAVAKALARAYAQAEACAHELALAKVEAKMRVDMQDRADVEAHVRSQARDVEVHVRAQARAEQSGDPLNERWRRCFDEEDEQIKTWLADGITRLVVSHAWASQAFLAGHVWATFEAEFCSRAQAVVKAEIEARARAEARAMAEAEARARAEARAKAEAEAWAHELALAKVEAKMRVHMQDRADVEAHVRAQAREVEAHVGAQARAGQSASYSVSNNSNQLKTQQAASGAVPVECILGIYLAISCLFIVYFEPTVNERFTNMLIFLARRFTGSSIVMVFSAASSWVALLHSTRLLVPSLVVFGIIIITSVMIVRRSYPIPLRA